MIEVIRLYRVRCDVCDAGLDADGDLAQVRRLARSKYGYRMKHTSPLYADGVRIDGSYLCPKCQKEKKQKPVEKVGKKVKGKVVRRGRPPKNSKIVHKRGRKAKAIKTQA